MEPPLVTRRDVLAGVLAVAAAVSLPGCDTAADRSPSGRAARTVDGLVADLLISDKEHLLRRYAEISMVHGDLAAALLPFTRRHEEHVDALAAAMGLPSPQPYDARWAIPSPWPSPPDGAAVALSGLADAEASASDSRRQLLSAAKSGRLAALIASIAACEAGHAILLRGLAG